MNPLLTKKANEDQEPFTLPQDDNPQGDMLDPATQQPAPDPQAVPAPKPVMEEDKQAKSAAASTPWDVYLDGK